jgi:O-antigen/teichoic acid export membrane protein
MISRKQHMRAAITYALSDIGRTIGMIVTFAIMPIFVRIFSVDEVATYKSFFLVYTLMYGLAQLGMAESL